MECISPNIDVKETFTEISNYSYRFAKESQETLVNTFLDHILLFQKEIRERREFFDFVIRSFEKLTWDNNIDDESLKVINDIISITRELHSKFIRYWANLNKHAKSFAKEEIKLLKYSLDDMKEATQDLEDFFFLLPKHKDFQEANKKVQSL